MVTGSRTCVCCACRKAVRRYVGVFGQGVSRHNHKGDPEPDGGPNICSSCHTPMVMLDKRRRIPKKDDLKGWAELEIYIEMRNLTEIRNGYYD